MTKEEEEAFAFYENTMYGDSEISEEEDLDDFTIQQKDYFLLYYHIGEF